MPFNHILPIAPPVGPTAEKFVSLRFAHNWLATLHLLFTPCRSLRS